MKRVAESLLSQCYQYQLQPTKYRLSGEQVKTALSQRQDGFHWLHVGTLPMPIGECLEMIDRYDLAVPRTGHLGNWQAIAAGYGGALDHNMAVCAKQGWAYPYIYDFVQTENQGRDQGDTVYLPGSIVSKAGCEPLPLYYWDGANFSPCCRERSYFMPFLQCHFNGTLQPLTQVQRQLCQVYPHARFNATQLLASWPKIKPLLHHLITTLLTQTDTELKLEDLFDRAVWLDGKMQRLGLERNGSGLRLDAQYYANVDAFLDALRLPIQAAAEPEVFFDCMDQHPQIMPFMSLPLLNALDYVMNVDPASCDADFNVYLEWGAFGSAAYPPRSKGYFKRQATVIRRIMRLWVQHFPEVKPTLMLLLPSAVFNLLPNSAYPEDIPLITELFEQLLTQGAAEHYSSADRQMRGIEALVAQWLSQHRQALSAYYQSRFSQVRCIDHQCGERKVGTAVFLPQFLALTFQQACMAVGALHQLGAEMEGAA